MERAIASHSRLPPLLAAQPREEGEGGGRGGGLVLYRFANSICAQKVVITLAEKGLPFESRNVNLFANEQYRPEYLKINPKGVVPSLVHEGRVLIESTLICEYLEEAFPTPRLTPADPFARAQMRLWSKAIDEDIFKATRELSFSAMFRERLRNQTEAEREQRFKNVGDPERGDRQRSTYELGVESPYVLQGIAAYEKLFAAMDDALADGRRWLVGEALTLGDINLMPFIARLEFLDLLDVWAGTRRAVHGWWARAKALPSFRAAITNHLTERELEPMQRSGRRIKARVAELRASLVH